MSADLLERAADLLRDAAAECETPTPWKSLMRGDEDYIALMHPPVANAVAAWLDAEVVRWRRAEEQAARVVLFPGSRRPDGWPAPLFEHALAVARAVLREENGGGAEEAEPGAGRCEAPA